MVRKIRKRTSSWDQGPGFFWILLALASMASFGIYEFGPHFLLPCTGKIQPLSPSTPVASSRGPAAIASTPSAPRR